MSNIETSIGYKLKVIKGTTEIALEDVVTENIVWLNHIEVQNLIDILEEYKRDLKDNLVKKLHSQRADLYQQIVLLDKEIADFE